MFEYVKQRKKELLALHFEKRIIGETSSELIRLTSMLNQFVTKFFFFNAYGSEIIRFTYTKKQNRKVAKFLKIRDS